MSISTDLYRQSLIAEQNRSELELLQNSSAQRGLLNSNSGNLQSVSQREKELQLQRDQAQVNRQLASAQLNSMKNKAHKLDVMG